MQEEEGIAGKRFQRDLHDIPGAHESCVGIPHRAFRLETSRSQPPIGEGEAGTAVVVLPIFDPNWAPIPVAGESSHAHHATCCLLYNTAGAVRLREAAKRESGTMASEELRYRSKTEVVLQFILAKLQSGEIQPGQRLRQDQIAEQLGISSTPVREALRRLEADGLVTYVPNKGVRVQDADSLEVHEAYPIRVLLEGYATRLAATRLTRSDLDLLWSLHLTMMELLDAGDPRAFSAINDRWHVTIYRAAGSRLLERTIRTIWTKCPWDAFVSIPGRSTASMAEHERVMQALTARDPDAAERAMAEHIRNGGRMVFAIGSARREPATD